MPPGFSNGLHVANDFFCYGVKNDIIRLIVFGEVLLFIIDDLVGSQRFYECHTATIFSKSIFGAIRVVWQPSERTP